MSTELLGHRITNIYAQSVDATDDIGNSILTGQDDLGAYAVNTFTPNNLNFHVSRVWHDRIEVMGNGASDAAIVVNGQTATRSGNEFRAQVPRGASAGAQEVEISVTAIRPDGDDELFNNVTGKVFIPALTEAPTGSERRFDPIGPHSRFPANLCSPRLTWQVIASTMLAKRKRCCHASIGYQGSAR